MRRKTKFRAFIKDYQSPDDDWPKDQMVQWFLYFFSDMSPVTNYGFEFPSDSNDVFLMQWSGLYDIDGVEIYEFDIVDIISKTTTFADVIIFENGCFGGVNNGCDIFNEKIRVIGNTYEHQQLIPPTTRKE